MNTTYKIVFSDKSQKQIRKLDNQTRNKILNYLDKIELIKAPKSLGKSLTGDLKGLWRYRVEDYRIICEIKETEVVILVLEVDHRKNIYK